MSRRQRGEAPQPRAVRKDLVDYLADLETLSLYLTSRDTHKLLKTWYGQDLSVSEKHHRVKNLLEWEKKEPGWLKRTYE